MQIKKSCQTILKVTIVSRRRSPTKQSVLARAESKLDVVCLAQKAIKKTGASPSLVETKK